MKKAKRKRGYFMNRIKTVPLKKYLSCTAANGFCLNRIYQVKKQINKGLNEVG